MTEVVAAPALRTQGERTEIKRLMVFFALVYFTEGVAQDEGLIAQPLNYYLKQVFQWTPVQIAVFLSVLYLPWIIKPLYGIVSDFIPLFGLRRKNYLIVANLISAGAYFFIARSSLPASLIFLMLLTAYGMAIASTVCGAILVENGQKLDANAVFVNQQWLWFNIATLVTSIMGGVLIEWLTPISAVHAAAAIAGSTSVLVIVGTLFLIDEEKSAISVEGFKESFASLVAALKERRLWVLAGFLFFYYFSPGIDTPLYFYMTDTLKFSQQYIGVLGSIQAAGAIAAALFYGMFLTNLSAKALLNLSILIGVIALLGFLFLFDPVSAALIRFIYGVSDMMATLAPFAIAADLCPKRSEGFSFAALIAITNLSGLLADNVGAYLFEHSFKNELYPLILVAAAFTAAIFLFVPLLKLKPEEHALLVPQ